MHKIVALFNSKKKVSEDELESAFPALSAQEEAEVLAALGLDATDLEGAQGAQGVIVGTLRRLHRERIPTPDSRAPSHFAPCLYSFNVEEDGADSTDGADEEEGALDMGTVRVKVGEHEALGTVRFKDGASFGTVRLNGAHSLSY